MQPENAGNLGTVTEPTPVVQPGESVKTDPPNPTDGKILYPFFDHARIYYAASAEEKLGIVPPALLF